MNNKILSIENFSMVFGGLRAVDQVDLHVDRGEIVALIGPNGAGKTTLFNCITGVYKPSEGNILINDDGGQSIRLNGKKPNKINEMGLARTFQNIRLFSAMTALENVMVGCHQSLKASLFGTIFRTRRVIEEEECLVKNSISILSKMGLRKYANSLASSLPYGVQRRLEIARALATKPQILLLDEPAAGMNSQETRELDDRITQIRDNEGVAILLIEHDMSLVMSLSERIYVLDYGKLIAEGTPEQIRSNKAVIQAYLGD